MVVKSTEKAVQVLGTENVSKPNVDPDLKHVLEVRVKHMILQTFTCNDSLRSYFIIPPPHVMAILYPMDYTRLSKYVNLGIELTGPVVNNNNILSEYHRRSHIELKHSIM